jgi:hypothetical protein
MGDGIEMVSFLRRWKFEVWIWRKVCKGERIRSEQILIKAAKVTNFGCFLLLGCSSLYG